VFNFYNVEEMQLIFNWTELRRGEGLFYRFIYLKQIKLACRSTREFHMFTERLFLFVESFEKKESNSPLKGNGKRKNEPHLSKPENKKAKLVEADSDEGISK
jgi:hypothetical protein